MSDSEYCYPPEFRVLKNKFDIRTRDKLEQIERLFVVQRMRASIPTGNFDLRHLQAIHHHLFQDVYDWAGEIRHVEISKGKQQFQFRKFIETGMSDIHRRIKTHNYLKNLDLDDFADLADELIGDINYMHPFREGNGRTQLIYLEQLSNQAKHLVDLQNFDKEAWIKASIHAHSGDYAPMAECIRNSIK